MRIQKFYKIQFEMLSTLLLNDFYWNVRSYCFIIAAYFYSQRVKRTIWWNSYSCSNHEDYFFLSYLLVSHFPLGMTLSPSVALVSKRKKDTLERINVWKLVDTSHVYLSYSVFPPILSLLIIHSCIIILIISQ